jgi:sugar lactone lactonase YvrE
MKSLTCSMIDSITARAHADIGGFGLNGAPDGCPDVDAETSITYLRATSASSSSASNETADGRLLFPNGCVVTPNGRKLIVAETFAARLTAWDRDVETGRLSNRRVWAELPGTYPDGICLDREGAVWVAISAYVPGNCVRPGLLLGVCDMLRFLFTQRVPGAVIRVHEGGRISDVVHTPESQVLSCMLGGSQGTTLFFCKRSDRSRRSGGWRSHFFAQSQLLGGLLLTAIGRQSVRSLSKADVMCMIVSIQRAV